MKKLIQLFLVSVSVVIFAQKIPEINKNEFSKEALQQKISSLEGKKSSISEVLKKHEEVTLFKYKNQPYNFTYSEFVKLNPLNND